MPACHRRSHAPGWGGVDATGAPRRKRATDGGEARTGSTIAIRRTEGVLQTPADDEGWKEESARAVTGLLPGCPLCAEDGYASGKRGVTAGPTL